MAYAVSAIQILDELRIVVASEGTGPAGFFSGESMEFRSFGITRGGTMDLKGHPNRTDALFLITGFYPVFQAQNAGIDLAICNGNPDGEWEIHRVVDMPYVHRLSVLDTVDGPQLMASVMCGSKTYQDDWSRPGGLYAISIPKDTGGSWQSRSVLKGLHRNHGLTEGIYRGQRALYLAADEGVVAVIPPTISGAPWQQQKVLDRSASELVFADIDGDGLDEMITVEAFHGDRLVVYHQDDDKWFPIAESELSFGHGLSTGRISGRSVVSVGNRSGSMDLMLYAGETDSNGFSLIPHVLDEGTASAGTSFARWNDRDVLIASNTRSGEYVMYSLSQ